MPFTKVGPGKYRSPSGRTYNSAQVRLYYSGTQPGFRPQDDSSNPLIEAYKRQAGVLPVNRRPGKTRKPPQD